MSEELNKKLIDTIIDENIEEKIKLNKVKHLVGSGADVNTKRDGRSVLSYVRLLGLNNKFEEFLKSSGAVEPNKLGLELMQAIANKDCNEVESLIANGADVNFDTKEFCTPLCYAIKTNSFTIVKTLIENGADVNMKNGVGSYETPLMMAAECGRLRIMKLLLLKEARVDERDAWGGTALIKAAEHGNEECLRCLIEHECDINVVSYSGTALMKAAKNGHNGCVRLLLQNNAEKNVRDVHGNAAGDLAFQNYHDDVADMLDSMWVRRNRKLYKGGRGW